MYCEPLTSQYLGVEKDIDSHIPLYMCSNIIDPDTVAFWYPETYRFQSGELHSIQLGDLGYFTDSGKFCPIFNIFHSYDENGAYPPCQPYQHLSVDLGPVVRQVDIPGPKIYTSSNIERTGQATGSHAKK